MTAEYALENHSLPSLIDTVKGLVSPVFQYVQRAYHAVGNFMDAHTDTFEFGQEDVKYLAQKTAIKDDPVAKTFARYEQGLTGVIADTDTAFQTALDEAGKISDAFLTSGQLTEQDKQFVALTQKILYNDTGSAADRLDAVMQAYEATTDLSPKGVAYLETLSEGAFDPYNAALLDLADDPTIVAQETEKGPSLMERFYDLAGSRTGKILFRAGYATAMLAGGIAGMGLLTQDAEAAQVDHYGGGAIDMHTGLPHGAEVTEQAAPLVAHVYDQPVETQPTKDYVAAEKTETVDDTTQLAAIVQSEDLSSPDNVNTVITPVQLASETLEAAPQPVEKATETESSIPGYDASNHTYKIDNTVRYEFSHGRSRVNSLSEIFTVLKNGGIFNGWKDAQGGEFDANDFYKAVGHGNNPDQIRNGELLDFSEYAAAQNESPETSAPTTSLDTTLAATTTDSPITTQPEASETYEKVQDVQVDYSSEPLQPLADMNFDKDTTQTATLSYQGNTYNVPANEVPLTDDLADTIRPFAAQDIVGQLYSGEDLGSQYTALSEADTELIATSLRADNGIPQQLAMDILGDELTTSKLQSYLTSDLADSDAYSTTLFDFVLDQSQTAKAYFADQDVKPAYFADTVQPADTPQVTPYDSTLDILAKKVGLPVEDVALDRITANKGGILTPEEFDHGRRGAIVQLTENGAQFYRAEFDDNGTSTRLDDRLTAIIPIDAYRGDMNDPIAVMSYRVYDHKEDDHVVKIVNVYANVEDWVQDEIAIGAVGRFVTAMKDPEAPSNSMGLYWDQQKDLVFPDESASLNPDMNLSSYLSGISAFTTVSLPYIPAKTFGDMFSGDIIEDLHRYEKDGFHPFKALGTASNLGWDTIQGANTTTRLAGNGIIQNLFGGFEIGKNNEPLDATVNQFYNTLMANLPGGTTQMKGKDLGVLKNAISNLDPDLRVGFLEKYIGSQADIFADDLASSLKVFPDSTLVLPPIFADAEGNMQFPDTYLTFVYQREDGRPVFVNATGAFETGLSLFDNWAIYKAWQKYQDRQLEKANDEARGELRQRMIGMAARRSIWRFCMQNRIRVPWWLFGRLPVGGNQTVLPGIGALLDNIGSGNVRGFQQVLAGIGGL